LSVRSQRHGRSEVNCDAVLLKCDFLKHFVFYRSVWKLICNCRNRLSETTGSILRKSQIVKDRDWGSPYSRIIVELLKIPFGDKRAQSSPDTPHPAIVCCDYCGFARYHECHPGKPVKHFEPPFWSDCERKSTHRIGTRLPNLSSEYSHRNLLPQDGERQQHASLRRGKVDVAAELGIPSSTVFKLIGQFSELAAAA
jgi:hypothetical protein